MLSLKAVSMLLVAIVIIPSGVTMAADYKLNPFTLPMTALFPKT